MAEDKEKKAEQAAEGLSQAYDVDYGQLNKKSRNPLIHATVVRAAAHHFPQAQATKELLKKASGSKYPDVQFLALAAKL